MGPVPTTTAVLKAGKYFLRAFCSFNTKANYILRSERNFKEFISNAEKRVD